MKPKKSSLTRMADMELRVLVLERDRFCQRCGGWFDLDWVECAHLAVKRARRPTRWELDNVALLCKPCHQHLDTHEVEREDFTVARIGRERYRELRRLAENGERVDTREELERLRALRRKA